MSDEALTITKEAVLKAAAQCSTARGVLKTLFPQAFPLKLTVEEGVPRVNGSQAVRRSESYSDAFYLDGDYDWAIEMRVGPSGKNLLKYLVPTEEK